MGQVFQKEHLHPTPKEVVAKALGYSGVNGASLGAISALLKYGLMDESGGSYKVTERAMAILHPQTALEKDVAIQEAAMSPALFADLTQHFQGSLPSDENLRAFLIRRGFSPGSLGSVVRRIETRWNWRGQTSG